MADNSMPEDETIRNQKQRLKDHRQNLELFLRQKVLQGGDAYVRAEVAGGIRENRKEITRIKTILRGWGIAVEDHPDDTEPPGPEQPPTNSPSPPSSEGPIHSSNSTHHPAPLPYLEGYLQCFTVNAAGEKQVLSSFFVCPVGFDALVGNPDVRDSRIVFGERGYGKTAVCLSIAERLSKTKKVLTIFFDEFDEFDGNQEETTIPLDVWLPVIRKKLLQALHQEIKRTGSRRSKIVENAEHARKFWGIYRSSGVEQTIVSQPDNALSLQEYQEMRPLAWFETLGSLIQQAGFKSVCLLLDGIKEQQKDMLRILVPLLDNRDALHRRSFSLRFFLPSSFEQELREHPGNQDILPTHRIVWDDTMLREMLSRRLQARANPTGRNTQVAKTSRFADLCAPELEFDPDERLVQAAQGSPRRLMHLAHTIIFHHCQTNHHAGLIAAETIEAVIRRNGTG